MKKGSKLGRKREFHGHSHHGKFTPEYTTWVGMIERCSNPLHKSWRSYGGRGIKVCERWKIFIQFHEDMGNRPNGCTLDRIDVNGNYEKSNCRWSTHREQGGNRRHNRIISAFGKTMCLSAFAREVGLSRELVRSRILRDVWNPERALSTPPRKR